MVNKKKRAQDAQHLLDNPTFRDVLEAIRSDAIAIFSEGHATSEQIVAAHKGIKAAQIVEDEVLSRISDGRIQEKREQKGQHRGSD